MSPPEVRLKLSPIAQTDLTSILQYTGERWGQDQLLSYRDKIDHALTLLAGHANLGHFSAELPATHRLYFVGSHVIVYRRRNDVTEVVRILHQRMSFARHV